MTHIAVLGSTNMDLVAHVGKAPRRGETVTGPVQRPGASASMPYRSEIEAGYTA